QREKDEKAGKAANAHAPHTRAVGVHAGAKGPTRTGAAHAPARAAPAQKQQKDAKDAMAKKKQEEKDKKQAELKARLAKEKKEHEAKAKAAKDKANADKKAPKATRDVVKDAEAVAHAALNGHGPKSAGKRPIVPESPTRASPGAKRGSGSGAGGN